MQNQLPDDVPEKGEGNHEADRQYREGVQESIEKRDLEQKAKEAKRDLPDTQKR